VVTVVGDAPSALVIGDFDGVNGPDVAVANAGGNDVTILLNDGQGAGGFLPPVNVVVGNGPSDITLGDFDGGNGPDLAVANRDDDTVTILINDGDGQFTALPATIPTGDGPRAVAAGHFDEGPTLDLVVANESDGTVMLFTGDGQGGFTPSGTFNVGPQPWAIDPEDLDNDEDLDVVVINGGSNTVTLLLNTGAGGFTTMEMTIGAAPSSLDIDDLDRDGDQDLLIVSGELEDRTVYVLQNDLNVSGELGYTLVGNVAGDPNLKLTEASDLNSDEVPDVIAVTAAEPDGGRKRTFGFVSVLLNTTPICWPDVNGDGTVDVLDLLAVLAAWGATSGPEDINGDGIVDVLDLLEILASWGSCP
jgi:hypothetical protein